jgi:hypothetical protein
MGHQRFALLKSFRNNDVKQDRSLTVFTGLAIAAAILIQTAAASANDTMARIAAGGIIFTQSEDIRMIGENL